MEIMVSQDGNSISSRQLSYVTKGLDNLLLSCECSVRLLPEKFPDVLCTSGKRGGQCRAGIGLASPASSATLEMVTPSDLLLQTPSQCTLLKNGSCLCPLMQQPPDPPVYDPSLSTEQLKELIISHYSSSSFH